MVLLSGAHGFHEKTHLIQSHVPQLLGFPVSSVVKGKKKKQNWDRQKNTDKLGGLDWYLKSREIQLPSLSPRPSAYSLLI